MQVIREDHLRWVVATFDDSKEIEPVKNWVCLQCRVYSTRPSDDKSTPTCYYCRKNLWTKSAIFNGLVDGTLISFSNTGIMYYEAAILP